MCEERNVVDSVLTVWYIIQCLGTVAFNVYILYHLWKQVSHTVPPVETG